MFFNRRPHRQIRDLNLVPLIDIFSMIIIFLIKGAVFGVASVEEPKGIQLPFSKSREAVEMAPQVSIQNEKVKLSLNNQEVPLSLFRPEAAESPETQAYLRSIQSLIKKLDDRIKKEGLLLNIMADQHQSYKDVFDVVKFFRSAGFQSVLLIASGKQE